MHECDANKNGQRSTIRIECNAQRTVEAYYSSCMFHLVDAGLLDKWPFYCGLLPRLVGFRLFAVSANIIACNLLNVFHDIWVACPYIIATFYPKIVDSRSPFSFLFPSPYPFHSLLFPSLPPSLSLPLGLSHWDPHAVRRGGCLKLYYCNMVEWFWCDSSLIFDDQLLTFSALTLLVWSSGL